MPTRRSFLSSSLAATTALAAAPRVLGANERVGVAVIGVNGMGHFHVRTLAARKDVAVVALCDVDPTPLARAAKTVKDATGVEPALGALSAAYVLILAVVGPVVTRFADDLARLTLRAPGTSPSVATAAAGGRPVPRTRRSRSG